MSECVDFILAAEVSRISSIHPFDKIPLDRLKSLFRHARIAFFRGGSVILHPEVPKPSPCFWVVREGRVQSRAVRSEGVSLQASPLQIGSMFPLEILLERQSADTFCAEVDCFLWEFDRPTIAQWMSEPRLVRWVAELLYEATERFSCAAADLATTRWHTDQALALPIHTFGSSALACASPEDSVRHAAATMRERGTGSVLVGPPDAPLGIVTQGDLVTRCLAEGKSVDIPLSEVMTPAPVSIDESATVLETGIEMAQHRFRRLLLRNERDGITGIVSERDLFRAQQDGLTSVFRPIDEARTVNEVANAAGRARDFEQRVFRQGMDTGQFMRLVSSFNDRIVRRLLAILSVDLPIHTEYCWLAFGSEAREEQGFVTDQDNGVVFRAPSSSDVSVVREQILEFARKANAALDTCGFSLCKGNIMAGNPDLCLTLDEWKDRFTSWIHATTPSALLNATIFFDMRPIFGDGWLAEAMHEHLLLEARGNTIFLHHLAANALEVSPPLGKISRFATMGGREGETIDFKTQGSRLFVDVARIYALGNGVKAANTTSRLRIAGQRIRRSSSAVEGDVAAFNFVQSIRLGQQLDSLKHGGDANKANPYTLDELKQRILRESLRQAESLQNRLRLDYKS
ncbi:MAG: CBS domain-containing protein [Thermomicrobiales bacterium]|nr:MAG: CBS domain-containing protein [Thermomicrobiales bacterium]